MSVDNHELIAPFCPESNDGDTFIYTEMLDRSKRKGNNAVRLLKTFYHRSREEFAEQWPTIKQLCDMGNVRACTRLAPRSYKKVGREFTRLVVDAAVTDNWAGMKSLYNRACGIAPLLAKLWLFDVDAEDGATKLLGERLAESGVLLATIPSRRAYHWITRPLDLRALGYQVAGDGHVLPTVQLHKDNPTNLYIPDGAA